MDRINLPTSKSNRELEVLLGKIRFAVEILRHQ
ncbi:hypothetical protein SAMN04489759_103249 [Sulfitobacter delicatus]|uniref:Uncharacterized protein n=1 Tax=Sulfitobacter delicatus TaxID=218672 RepID=A0A1G7P7I5_9RHOB|nr:hypothetical protein SAMN04489759_103249 [Sulfitobacter delicatus]